MFLAALSHFTLKFPPRKDKATGQRLETYTIVTTDPNELMEPLHNRMPVILAPKDDERWLAPLTPHTCLLIYSGRSPAH
jgi:putative SOS response-associated peptidase YedK